jgi:alpha-glucosidase (family GH31 glycosyl hydrolase)
VGGKTTIVHLLDLTNPTAVRWWQGNLRHILVDLGFDGWLQDLGDRLPPMARFADGGGPELANLYPILLAQTVAAVVRTAKPDALFVMRSGFAGSQAYQPAVWAGDQQASWDPRVGLPAVIPAGLSWGIAQAPMWGSDIGGYLDGHLPRMSQEELWLRWLELGALSPIMRDELGDKGTDAVYLWTDPRLVDVFRRYAQLHQALVPYLAAAARVAHETGLPIMRHLFLAYPSDRQVYGLDDEYLLGPDLLVAPVITPGATSRSVYLPAGTWLDAWTGVALRGGGWVTVAAPLERVPLFVRGGALLPFLAQPGDTLAPATDPGVHRAGDALLLRLYPEGPGETVTLIDGTTLADTLGPLGISLRIAGATTRVYEVSAPVAAAPTLVRLSGERLPLLAATSAPDATGWFYDAPRSLLTIRVRVASGAIDVVGTTLQAGESDGL